MIDFSELRLAPEAPLITENWNGLLDRVKELPLTIDHNGNVGIGASAPEAKLHIKGRLKIQTDFGTIGIGPNNEGWAHFNTDRSKFYFEKEIRVDTGKIGSYNQNLQLCTEGKTRVTINKSDGTVGIGITTPVGTLDVNGGHIVMRRWANDNTGKTMLGKLPNNSLVIGGPWENKLIFYWKDKDGTKYKGELSGAKI